MFRTLSLVSALILATAFPVSDGAAQAKKKSPQCVANFHDACMKRCLNGGGQPRLCPQFCQKRERELGC
jgi:hypothetical protein